MTRFFLCAPPSPYKNKKQIRDKEEEEEEDLFEPYDGSRVTSISAPPFFSFLMMIFGATLFFSSPPTATPPPPFKLFGPVRLPAAVPHKCAAVSASPACPGCKLFISNSCPHGSEMCVI